MMTPTEPSVPLPFVRTVLEREEVDSTSNLTIRLLERGGVALPLLVRASRQVAGRGRGDRRWWSDEGSLTFTVAFDPAAHGLRPDQESRVALASAVAIVDALGRWLPADAAGIRWPNDVEVGGRKLGGLLPERVETREGPRLVLGIGLNVATRLADAPAEIRGMATSIEAERRDGAPTPGLGEVLAAILGRLPGTLDALARDDGGLALRWAGLDTLRGRPVVVDLGGPTISGIGGGIAADGALCLETERETRRLYGGSVLRGPAGG
jgi:BirA family biotin operon repressor/biotin-[acetyl-CoA-carboxylase] ligase